MSSSPDAFRSWAHIHLAHLEYNLAAIRAALPAHLRYISVVKANAYGHGLEPIVTRLMRSSADAFAVANLEEAARLRLVGKGWQVLILSALLPGEFRDAVELRVCPVISSHEELDGLGAAAARKKQRVDIHLKVDTGMGRLGVWHERAAPLIAACLAHPWVRLCGICTHFASADSDPEFTRLQRDRMRSVLTALAEHSPLPEWIHADNSAGLDSFPDGGPFNAARVGLLQFGVDPAKGEGALLATVHAKPVLSFHARIVLVKDLPAGTTLSYGGTHRLQHASRIAVLSAGYADGIPYALSNQGQVIVSGRLCPIVGRVTMDQTLVDVSSLEQAPTPGQAVTLIGSEGNAAISAWDFSRAAGTIPWETLCALSARTQRVYSTDSAV